LIEISILSPDIELSDYQVGTIGATGCNGTYIISLWKWSTRLDAP
jgi:hypothetical protein